MEKDINKEKFPKGFVRRKDGRLVARYYDKYGKRHEVIQRKDENRKDLERRRDKLKYEAQYGNPVKVSNITVNELGEKWLDSLFLKKTTLKAYHTNMNHINDFIGEKSVSKVSRNVINSIFAYLKEETVYTYGTVFNIRQTLYALFEFAKKENLITENPVDKSINVKKDQFTKTNKDKVLTEKQQEIFLKHIEKSHYFEMFYIMLLTGMRIGEVLGLRWEDVSLEDKVIHIERNLVCTTENGQATGSYIYEITSPKTELGFRNIPLCDEAVLLFKSQMAKRKDNRKINKDFGDLIFTGRNGIRVSDSNIRRILRSVSHSIQKNECPDMPTIHPHMFRHTFATRAVELGMNYKSLSMILGHSKYQFTLDTYAHPDMQYLKEEMNKLKIVGFNKVN